jgi:hypothetical protein
MVERLSVQCIQEACGQGTCKNTYTYLAKIGILTSFTVVRIWLDRVCLRVFAILKQATPSKSGPVQPLTRRAPQNPHTQVLLLSINWHIHFLYPIHGAIIKLCKFPVDSRCCHSRKHIQSVNPFLHPLTLSPSLHLIRPLLQLRLSQRLPPLLVDFACRCLVL